MENSTYNEFVEIITLLGKVKIQLNPYLTEMQKELRKTLIDEIKKQTQK